MASTEGRRKLKIGDVMKKERLRRRLSTADAAVKLGVPEPEYERIEAGESDAERWGPLLARIAIELEIPTSRFISESGKSAEARNGECGKRVRTHREIRNKTVADMARLLEIPIAEYEQIEACSSPIEKYGPLLLRFAEAIDQPIFNLFYPCGLSLEKLTDYP